MQENLLSRRDMCVCEKETERGEGRKGERITHTQDEIAVVFFLRT